MLAPNTTRKIASAGASDHGASPSIATFDASCSIVPHVGVVSVVVPEPGLIKVPLAYPIARHDDRWVGFVNVWRELKRRDGTIDTLYRHWILGQDAEEKRRRWSILRDVLHWVK